MFNVTNGQNYDFFRITDGTEKVRTLSANCARARMVDEVQSELKKRFKLASVPEPRESAQYIVAHALGHKTVSLSVWENGMRKCMSV